MSWLIITKTIILALFDIRGKELSRLLKILIHAQLSRFYDSVKFVVESHKKYLQEVRVSVQI